MEARTHLNAGIDIASQLGADPLVHLAHTELRAAGGRPRSSRVDTGPESLTPSERRVATLAANVNITNRAIAQELFITVKTVEVHLSSVYRKLGITGRAQLAVKL